MDGQITITDYFSKQIKKGAVMDLTNFINSSGKAQFTQVRELIEHTGILKSEEDIFSMANAVSVYILDKSLAYMEYLRKETE